MANKRIKNPAWCTQCNSIHSPDMRCGVFEDYIKELEAHNKRRSFFDTLWTATWSAVVGAALTGLVGAAIAAFVVWLMGGANPREVALGAAAIIGGGYGVLTFLIVLRSDR